MSKKAAALQSMTGFGESRAKLEGISLVCRARSVNHRFLDMKVRLPRAELIALDQAVRKRLAETFKRGAIELTITREDTAAQKEATLPSINSAAVEAYAKQAAKLARKLKLKPVTIDALLRLPGAVESINNDYASVDTLDPALILSKLVDPALAALRKARESEGTKLRAILMAHLDVMDRHLHSIEGLEAGEKERARAQVIERAQETAKLLSSISSAPLSEEFSARLREEAVFWIERRDFAEERARLGMHLKEFRELLNSSTETLGRKLEFLQQEILREINTLGTKSQSTVITSHTIELKAELERIREQLANVE